MSCPSFDSTHSFSRYSSFCKKNQYIVFSWASFRNCLEHNLGPTIHPVIETHFLRTSPHLCPWFLCALVPAACMRNIAVSAFVLGSQFLFGHCPHRLPPVGSAQP